MKKVVIVGAGGHAAELVDYLYLINQLPVGNTEEKWEIVGLIDDSIDNYNIYQYKSPYIGDIKNHVVTKEVNYIIGIANMKYRRKIICSLMARGANFASVIHPTALISPSAKIGHGCVISHNVSIGPKAILGDFNLINSRCTIGHDSKIGDYNFISPQVVIGGFAELANENFIGTNAVVLPFIMIGNNNTVAAGMIVDKKVEDYATVFHRFKEKIIIISNPQNGD